MKLILLLITFIQINSLIEDEESLETVSKLNSIEAIDENKVFKIQTEENSIAYFDSFDGNSVIYISENYQDFISKKEEKITGVFYPIEKDKTYFVRIKLYNSRSSLKQYLYPIESYEITLSGTDSFFFLKKGFKYNIKFDFDDFVSIYIYLKLSKHTLNSEINITDSNSEIILNNDNQYSKTFSIETKKAEAKNGDGFIELIKGINVDLELFDVYQKDYELKNDIIAIYIPQNDKDFSFYLESSKEFKFSFSYGFAIKNDITGSAYYYVPNLKKKLKSIEENGIYKTKNITINTPFKEFKKKTNYIKFIVNIFIIDKNKNDKIYLTYGQKSQIDGLLDQKLDESYCNNVITNLFKVFDAYVFTEIATNPPKVLEHSNYHHKEINLKEELNKVQKTNRKFYEFYQEIKKILTSPRDLHFDVALTKFENNNNVNILFNQYNAILPFDFCIKKYEDSNEFRVFIEINIENYQSYFNNFQNINQKENINNFLIDHLNIPIKSINNMNPFDYIQNWNKFGRCKNAHAEFVHIIKDITNFYLVNYPVNYSDINLNEYEFEDNKFIRLPYKVINPDKNDKVFNQYFDNYIKNFKFFQKIPSINIIKKQFLLSQGIENNLQFNLKKSNSIKWDVEYENSEGENYYLKCRVDEKNKVNVVIQNSFGLDTQHGLGVMLKCAELFYSNNYPLFIIESKNGGGYSNLAIIFNQILQIRTSYRNNAAYKYSNIVEDIHKYTEVLDLESCQYDNPFKKGKVSKDYYYNGNKIEHYRTKLFDDVDQIFRNALKSYREKYLNSPNLKKPTDIIIFTDSYSFSAAATFITSFQTTGGAIVVGYYGNPTIKGIDYFDSSQSNSLVENELEGNPIFQDLVDLGFGSIGITMGESFDDLENDIPMEYSIYPVDDRINIYSEYSDEIYEDFIQEGIKIHNKFNNINENNENINCNSQNDKLFLFDNSCFDIFKDQKTHGGFKCGKNNKWDTSQCSPSFCEIGYYFNQKYKICKEECKSNFIKSLFIYENNYDNIFELNKDIHYQFVLALPKRDYMYFYRCSEENLVDDDYPKVGFIKNNLSVNKFKNAKDKFQLRIKGFQTSVNYETIFPDDIEIDNIYTNKKMIIFKINEDFVFYSRDTININNNYKLAVYDDKMTFDDIIKVNNVYFKEYNDEFIILKKDKIYIIYFNYNKNQQYYMYLNRIINPSKIIEITNNDINFLYLEIGNSYILNLTDNQAQKNPMIYLSRKTLNSEVEILFIKQMKIYNLNSNNLYCKIPDSYRGHISIDVKKENAFLEFRFTQDKSDLNELEYSTGIKFKAKKRYNLIYISENFKGRIIKIVLSSDKNLKFNIYAGYSIKPYTYYANQEKGHDYSQKEIQFEISEHYNNVISLMKDEYYCIMLEIFDELFISIEDNFFKDTTRYIIWVVVPIVFVVVVVVVLLVFAYKCDWCKYCKRNSQKKTKGNSGGEQGYKPPENNIKDKSSEDKPPENISKSNELQQYS